ncbi:MAG: thiamine-phosphate kinase, partial [Gaiellaceae bacterium]
MRLTELGEFGLLAELERRGLVRGQDAEGAVLADGVVVTQDTLVEGVHFRRSWTSWRDLGYKAAAVNLSDLAAMGAEPEALLVALAVPLEVDVEAIAELYEGLNGARVAVAGGDTTRAERLALTVTAVGRSERVPGRAGARPG